MHIQMIYLLIILTLGSVSSSFAQKAELSQEERTNLLTALKNMKKDPAIWKAFKARNAQRIQELEARQQALSQMQDKLDEKLDRLDYQKVLIDSLQSTHLAWLRKTRNYRDNLVFKVQIAGYRKHPIDRFHKVSPMFMYDMTSTGVKRYLLGHFYSYGEAYKFKDIIRMMGGDAFVVGFKNGYRLRVLSNWISN